MKLLRPEEVNAENILSLRWEPESTPEELKEVYALGQAAFTAADLQEYLDLDWDDGVPAEDLLKEMEEAQKRWDAGEA